VVWLVLLVVVWLVLLVVVWLVLLVVVWLVLLVVVVVFSSSPPWPPPSCPPLAEVSRRERMSNEFNNRSTHKKIREYRTLVFMN
jgi:uncharacterized protein (DUF58 family)